MSAYCTQAKESNANEAFDKSATRGDQISWGDIDRVEDMTQ